MVPDVVRQLIRYRIEDGRLPRERTIELWHGAGFGQICDGCDLPISTNDGMTLLCSEDWKAIRFHDDCFHAWNAERAHKPDEE